MVQAAEGILESSPRDRLAAARLSHNHGGVSGIFGLVQLNYFGHCEGGHLETALMKFRFYCHF